MPFGKIKDKNGLFNPCFSGLLKREGEILNVSPVAGTFSTISFHLQGT